MEILHWVSILIGTNWFPIGTINIHQYLSNIMVYEQCTLPAVWLKKWRKDTGDFEDSIIVGCDGLFGFLVQSHTRIHL